MGEGAAALTLETEAAAAERGATVLGEVLGFGSAGEALGLLPVRDDGDGLVRAIQAALANAAAAAGAGGPGRGSRQWHAQLRPLRSARAGRSCSVPTCRR